MTKNKQIKPPFNKPLTDIELANLSDDDIDYSDIPETTKGEIKNGIKIPKNKFKEGLRFLNRRNELANQCSNQNDINYSTLKPDEKFWEEITLEPKNNVDDAIKNLIARKQNQNKSQQKNKNIKIQEHASA